MFGTCETVLETTEFGEDERRVTTLRWNKSHICRELGQGLDMTVDIVDKEQDVTLFFVTEVFSSGCGGGGDHRTDRWRAVHLTKEHHCVFENIGFLECFVELVTLTDTLPDTAVD